MKVTPDRSACGKLSRSVAVQPGCGKSGARGKQPIQFPIYRSMKGGCQEKHLTVGRQPGQKQQRRGSQPQFSVTRTDAPAVEGLQSMSDIVRKTISNWDDYGRP